MTDRELLRHLGDACLRALIGVSLVCAMILAHEPHQTPPPVRTYITAY